MEGSGLLKPEAGPALPDRAAESPEKQGGAFEAPRTIEQPAEAPDVAPAPTAAAPAAPDAVLKDPTLSRVENVLEERLKDAYLSMPEARRRKFKEEGEKASHEIAAMVRALKPKVSRILALLRHWLKMIPGVNRLFLIQEAKIKTDKIMAMVEDEKKKQGLA